MGNERALSYLQSDGARPGQRGLKLVRTSRDGGVGQTLNPLYDAPHDVGHKYLQWALHLERADARLDFDKQPTCLHCGGSAPCTARVCINCQRPFARIGR